jgi:hypothetical protein
LKLERIRIQQFRQFRQPLEINHLAAGLNLFTGPNEAGKSTVVAAIRAAFFERYRSSSVDDLRPWGDSAAAPTVELDFVVAGHLYQLTKSFLGKKRCDLRINSGVGAGVKALDGVAAEDHLADLLGFQYAGRGASGAKEWGIPGLLWIQQGSAHEIAASAAHAVDHLRSALKESLGEVTSSTGDAVLDAVKEQRDALLTPTTGAAKGDYAEAVKRESALKADIDAVQAEIDVYRQKVDKLADMRRACTADEREKPWETLRKQALAAHTEWEAVAQLQTTLVTHKQSAAQLESHTQSLCSQLENFAAQEKNVELRKTEAAAAHEALRAATHLAEQWQLKAAEASQQNESARDALRLARREDTRRSLTRQLQDIQLKLTTTAATVSQAQAAGAALLTLQTQAKHCEIAADELKTLRDQQRELRELQIQQNAVATRLRFTLNAGCSVQIGSDQIAGGHERLLREATTVLLPGLGSLEITPGGTDLAQLRQRETSLADSHTALLQRLGLASVDAAEAHHQTHTQLLQQIKTAQATLKAYAPKGLDALQSEHADQAAQASKAEQVLTNLPPLLLSHLPITSPVLSISEAEAHENAACQRLETLTADWSQALIQASAAQTRLESAARELAAAHNLLNTPERAEQAASTHQKLVQTRAEQAALAAQISTLTAQIEVARPDILLQDAERFKKSADQHQSAFAERQNNLMRLEVELETAGAKGLDERCAELTRDFDLAQRRATELRRRAAALDHLLQILRTKRQALTRKLQAPLQKHLNHYLPMLFPQAGLEIDENLAPGPLTRLSAPMGSPTGAPGTELAAFDALSFGAREQLGVISRLAYADLLQEAGRPTLIILDDVLVHSDEVRLGQMKRVLFDAATRHQILLFTCHPANWRDMGVAARLLRE